MPSRAQYVAYRVGARMQNRGDPMVLRRTTIDSGPVPYRNPPDTSADLVVATGVTLAGQAYLGVTGASIIGRLVAGDQIITGGTLTWTVGVMPNTIETDSDGIIIVDDTGTPVLGTPTLYNPDSLAAADAWPAIPVSAAGTPDPAGSIGDSLAFVFTADQAVYGVTLSFEEMTALGWTQVDTIGLRVAAYNAGVINAPKVDDLIFVNGTVRAVLAVGEVFRQGVELAYTVQAR